MAPYDTHEQVLPSPQVSSPAECQMRNLSQKRIQTFQDCAKGEIDLELGTGGKLTDYEVLILNKSTQGSKKLWPTQGHREDGQCW